MESEEKVLFKIGQEGLHLEGGHTAWRAATVSRRERASFLPSTILPYKRTPGFHDKVLAHEGHRTTARSIAVSRQIQAQIETT